MPNPIGLLVADLRDRGVALECVNWKLLCRGNITAGERDFLIQHAPTVESILNPDLTLPDVLWIPASVSNE
jgi:hypothetical protein